MVTPMKFDKAFTQLLVLVGVCFLATLAAAAILDWHATTEFQRGVIAGRQQAIEEAARKPHDCVSWWFQGDPTRADRNLRAACAARKAP